MDQTVLIKLVKETVSYGEYAEKVVSRSIREVYAQKRGIARSEWFEAGRNGFNPDITFITNIFDYDGEATVEWNDTLFGVYRTYTGRNDKIELYCEKKGGLVNGTAEKVQGE